MTQILTQYADYHSQLGNGFSMTDPSTWENIPGQAIKFTAAALGSGLNSFYNTGVAVGNFFGAELEENDTEAWLSGMDSDLGQYYRENKTAADLVGFIGTSFIPGTQGTKLVNLGARAMRLTEAGTAGANAAMHTGVLGSKIAGYTQEAIEGYKASGAAFTLWNGKFLKASTTAFAQEAIDAAVFEAAVTATMFKNPVLEDMDMKDLAWNSLTGVALGGALGGALRSIKINYDIKAGVKAADLETNPLVYRSTMGDNISADMKAAYALRDLHAISNFDFSTISASAVNRAKSIQQTSIKDAQIDLRNSIHQIIKSDKDFANYFTDQLIKQPSLDAAMNMLNTASMGRVGDKILTFQQHVDKLQAVAQRFKARETELVAAQKVVDDLAAVGKQSDKYDKKLAKALERFQKAEAALPNRDVIDPTTGAKITMSRKLQEVYIDLHDGAIYLQKPLTVGISDSIARLKGETITQALQRRVTQENFQLAEKVDYAATDRTELRYMWAERNFAKKETKLDALKDFEVAYDDIPSLQTILIQGNFENLPVRFDGGLALMSKQELKKHILDYKDALARKMAGQGMDTDQIARALDVDPKAIEGIKDGNVSFTDETGFYRQTLRNKGINPNMPRYAYSVKDVTFAQSPFALDAAAVMDSEAKIARMRRESAVRLAVGDSWVDRQVRITADDIMTASRESGGPGKLSSASGDHLSLTSKSQYIGAQTHELIAATRQDTEAAMGSAANALLNNEKSAQAFSLINAKTQATVERYFLGTFEGESGLISAKLKNYLENVSKAKEAGINPASIVMEPLQEGAEAFLSFKGDQILETAMIAHVKRTYSVQSRIKAVRESRGEQFHQVLEDAFVPIRPDPKDYPYHAMVTDKTIAGAGRVRMVTASSAENLRKLTDGIDTSRYDIQFKPTSEAYHKAMKDYEWDLSIHDNYYDASKIKKGHAAPVFPLTDKAAISAELMKFHMSHGDYMVRESAKTMHIEAIDGLHKMGLQWRQAEESTRRGFGRFGKEKLSNPYESYTKMILDVPQHDIMPTYMAVSNTFDEAVSKMWQKVKDSNPFTGGDNSVDEAYKIMTEAGYNTAYNGAAEGMYQIINQQVSKGVLTRFIRTVNVVLGNLMLRSDIMNAVNNAIGANILEGTELASLLRKIRTDDPTIGVLGKLDLTTPTGDKIKSAAPLILEGRMKVYSSDPVVKKFEQDLVDRGILKTLGDVNRELLEEMTFRGAVETDSAVLKRIQSIKEKAAWLSEKAETWTGNRHAEWSNRFTTAWTAKVITDKAVQQGLITQQEAWVVINTHVNRVHGNIVASQRPLFLQGPIGQAFGLFQSYQFNLMQQLFRYVGEGKAKDSLTLLGLQGSIYGVHGLPGFEFLNTHIVGTASGNQEHKDLYTATYGVLGKTVGDWLLYGAPSNLSGMALYTRGDINPRHPTIIPLDPTQLPQWQIPAKALGNLFDTFKALGDGGDAKAVILRGIEHNAMSRPLAGLGALLQGYTTTGQGNVNYKAPDWAMDAATLVHLGRLSGGKPLQEAIINDELFRKDTYAAADLAKRKELGKTLKAEMIGEEMPSQERLHDFMTKYVEAGGKQQNFAKWAGEQYRNANEPQANQLANSLTDPYAKRMQLIMGAQDPFEPSE